MRGELVRFDAVGVLLPVEHRWFHPRSRAGSGRAG